jgi:hypothetical protein
MYIFYISNYEAEKKTQHKNVCGDETANKQQQAIHHPPTKRNKTRVLQLLYLGNKSSLLSFSVVSTLALYTVLRC